MLKAFLGHWQPRRRGWYDGWMIHDITVPNIAAPRKDSRAQFGTITPTRRRDPPENGHWQQCEAQREFRERGHPD
jgi:hypothetical protein